MGINIGCFGWGIIIFVVLLAIVYWQITIPLAIVGSICWYFYEKSPKTQEKKKQSSTNSTSSSSSQSQTAAQQSKQSTTQSTQQEIQTNTAKSQGEINRERGYDPNGAPLLPGQDHAAGSNPDGSPDAWVQGQIDWAKQNGYLNPDGTETDKGRAADQEVEQNEQSW